MPTRPRMLLLSQVYVPDPAAVGQYLHDTTREMVRRGWQVTVICSSRGYDDPSKKYPRHELRDGVHIRRYGLPFFSKSNKALRIFGSIWAMIALLFLGLSGGRADVVMFSTSPPMVGVLGLLVAALKRARSVYWAMDLNPDQLVALGKLTKRSPIYRAIESVNRTIISRTRLIVALDRFMATRLSTDGRRPQEVLTIPPWPQESVVQQVANEDNPFRTEHGLAGKFVVMYSGNHTPANPLDTILAAAERLQDEQDIRFLFVGGGLEKAKIRKLIASGVKNVVDLPYQPFETLRYSLSAADVHVVTLGHSMVGIIHPCKVYGAMNVGRPVLFIGPRPSHVDDLLAGNHFGRSVSHGEVDGCVAAIRALRDLSNAARAEMGRTGMSVLKATLSEERLNGEFCDAIERIAATA